MKKRGKKEVKMAKKSSERVLNFLVWFTGIVISLVVGSGMVNGTLGLPWWLGGNTVIGAWIVVIVGYIVLITTLVGALMAILKK
jgi:hypothetical protein